MAVLDGVPQPQRLRGVALTDRQLPSLGRLGRDMDAGIGLGGA